jgi:hypothetical protein
MTENREEDSGKQQDMYPEERIHVLFVSINGGLY